MKLKFERDRLIMYLTDIDEKAESLENLQIKYFGGEIFTKSDKWMMEKLFSDCSEFVIKCCDDICINNNGYFKLMTSIDKLKFCNSIGLLNNDVFTSLKILIKIRTDVIHEYWLDYTDTILKYVRDEFKSFRAFYTIIVGISFNKNIPIKVSNQKIQNWVNHILSLAPSSTINDYGNSDNVKALNFYLNLNNQGYDTSITEEEAIDIISTIIYE